MADRNRGLRTFLNLAALAWITVVAAMGTAPGIERTRVFASGEPATLCIPPSDPAAAELRSGRRRAVLVVHAREGDGSLHVSVPATETETRIGLFPDGDFNVTSGDEARRFLLPSAKGAEADDICFDIRLEGARDGQVEVSLDVAEAPQQ